MKLKFKHQKFQADAAKAVVDVIAGQLYLTPTYTMDSGQATSSPLPMILTLQAGVIRSLCRNFPTELSWKIYKKYKEQTRSHPR